MRTLLIAALTLASTLSAADAQPALVRALSDGGPELTVQIVRLAHDAEACTAAGLPTSCHEVCLGTVSHPDALGCALTAAPPAGQPVAEGYVCADHVCKKVLLMADGAVRLDERVCSYPAIGQLADHVALPEDDEPAVAHLIDPDVYEWITGRDCCADCWAAHRAMGLPCWADIACCLSGMSIWNQTYCGIDPNCNGGDIVDDLPETETAGGALSSMGPSVDVVGVEIDYLGRRCLFDGRLDPTVTDEGFGPAGTVGQGVIHSCR